MALSTVCFDLETFNLDANFGIVFCGVIKEEGKDPVVLKFDKVDPKSWRSNRSNDSKLVATIAEELSKHPMWVAHNGRRFDIPYLNTRLIHHNFRPLPSPKVLIDPVELARNKLRMSYNSLEQLASLLGCNSKTPVDHQVWSRAAFDGCKESLEYITSHCIEDVMTLEKVVNKLQDLSTGFNACGSGR